MRANERPWVGRHAEQVRGVIRCGLRSGGGAILLLVATQLSPIAAVGETSCGKLDAAAAARLVQARYDGIQDFAADFLQQSHATSFGGESSMGEAPKKGSVVLAKPGRMRWAYSEPEPSIVVSDGRTLWIYDVAEQSATRLPVTEGYLTGAALEFLLGNGRLVDQFEVRVSACSSEELELLLLPRVDASYERLGLTIRPDSGEIVETSATDLFGNKTTIRFSNAAVDQEPASSLFEFDPPTGVEIIDLQRPEGGGGALPES